MIEGSTAVVQVLKNGSRGTWRKGTIVFRGSLGNIKNGKWKGMGRVTSWRESRFLLETPIPGDLPSLSFKLS